VAVVALPETADAVRDGSKACAAFLSKARPALPTRRLALIQGRKLQQRATGASSLLIA
jgi:hypothetical protein